MFHPSFSLVRTGSFALSIVSGAFLVFQVQPIVSKAILPWFGGGPAVWTTCVLFFQVFLFGGYLYSHLLTRWLAPRWQGAIHLSLVTLSLFALPIVPDEAWKPAGGESPIPQILSLLLFTVGVPYFVLSATGPLMQAWFVRTTGGRSPYRWFSLSNLGSLTALLSYPFVFEPQLSTGEQGAFWSVMFAVYAAACGACVIQLWQAGGNAPQRDEGSRPAGERPDDDLPGWRTRLEWLALPAFASVVLLAVTNHVCQNVSVTPFMWVVPLSLYLLTFIICFDSPRWYRRGIFATGAALACLAITQQPRSWFPQHYLVEVTIYFTALFFICILCHGELVRRKPHPRHLTSFYLFCSAGGALGGVLVALVCPLIFDSYFEMNLSTLCGYVLALAVLAEVARATGTQRILTKVSVAAAVLLGLVVVTSSQMRTDSHEVVEATRNFYGVLKVRARESDNAGRGHRVMCHGRVVHGTQFTAADRRHEPTTYYHRKSGVGLTLDWCRRTHSGPIRVGVVGLGAGTMAAYGREGDYYRFYEINPDVVTLANRHFTYLNDCAAEVEIVLGDARLSMEHEPPQQLDVLVLDAFSGDAIPTHLLTREAFGIYRRHLRPDGVIATHISNLHLDLMPVVRGLAEHYGLDGRRVFANGKRSDGEKRSDWVLLSNNQRFLSDESIRQVAIEQVGGPQPVVFWTDTSNNLFQVLK